MQLNALVLRRFPDQFVATTDLTEQFFYDDADRMVNHIDQRNESTQFGYDLLGRQTVVVDPNLNNTRFAYDAYGNMVSETASGSGRVAGVIACNNPAQLSLIGG